MVKITESSVFPDDVPLLEIGTQVLGGPGGPSNMQAEALANRTRYLKDQLESLDASDVGAEPAGTTALAMSQHIADPDPHTQYLKETDADTKYLKIAGSNVPGGWVKLDANGKIPSALLDMIQSSYLVVADKAARLALPQTDNLTIAVQLDEDRLYYLNGALDPTVDANWYAGQSATVNGVGRVFGRTGDIVAKAGDYNADQITETANKEFVTPAQKTSWTQKQDLLISGTNIKTFNGMSLLGPGDFAPTPDQLGCAAAKHTHTTADISDYTTKTQQMVIGSLEAGPGISLGLNPVSGKTTISGTGGSGDGAGYIVNLRNNSLAGQAHSFIIPTQTDYDLSAYALKEEDGSKNQANAVGNFAANQSVNYNATNLTTFTGVLSVYRGESFILAAENNWFTSVFKKDVDLFSLNVASATIIPQMSANVSGGYTARASSEVSSNYPAYKAFDRASAGGIGDCWAGAAKATDAAPQWLAIDLPSAVTITGYGIQNRLNGDMACPTKWKLQGSNDKSTWEDIGGVMNDTDMTYGKVRNFAANPTKAYSSYRLFITEINGTFDFTVVQEFMLYISNRIMFLDDDGTTGYTVDANKQLVAYPKVTNAQINQYGFGGVDDLTPSVFAGKNISKLVGTVVSTVNEKATPGPQIAIQKSLTDATTWEKINSAVATFVQNGNDKIALAVTRDGTDWKVLSNGAWVSIGNLTVDATGAAKLIAQGMTPTALNAITPTQWAALFGGSGAKPDKIAFAYGLSVTPSTIDPARINSLNLYVDNVSSWRLQTPAEVVINWRRDSITFLPVAAGNYRFAYQIK